MEAGGRGRVLPVAPNSKALGRQAELNLVNVLGSMEPAIVVVVYLSSHVVASVTRPSSCLVMPKAVHARAMTISGHPSLYLIEPLRSGRSRPLDATRSG